MTWILEGVKVGDPVIVVSSNIGPDGLRRTVRNIECVTKVFTHVLRTDSMSGVEIATGRTPWTYGGKAVAPASDADVADVLRSLDLFVLPSQTEGTSCTLQEAMASGLPVVATAVGGTPDLVQEGVTGRLVPPDDEQALADAMVHAFGSPGNCASSLSKS